MSFSNRMTGKADSFKPATETVEEWKARFLREQDEKKARDREEFEQQQKANALKEVCRVESFTLPDGEYYVGCPYLVIPDDGDYLYDKFAEFDSGLNEMDGHKLIYISTGGDGYWRLYDMNEDGAGEDPETGEPVDGPIHKDSLPTDVASMSIMPTALLKELGCDMDHVEESGYTFCVESGGETDEENTFEVEFKYKMYEGHDREELSYVEFLWFKLNVACQYQEDED